MTRLKDAGRRLPTDLPARAYRWYAGSDGTDPESLPFGDDVVDAYFPPGTGGLVVFPWNTNPWSRSVEAALADRDVGMLALPHGDAPFMNMLSVQSGIERLVADRAFERHAGDHHGLYGDDTSIDRFDVVAAPNRRRATHRREDVADTNVEVLGSPRYNDEWIDINARIAPTMPTDASTTSVVFFLRNGNYLLNERLVELTVRIIAQLPDVSLVLAEHPRVPLLDSDTFDDLPNVRTVRDGYPSASLIEAGDVFLDIGTSITFECVVREDPLLSMDYLHGNENVTGHHFEEAKMESVDDLYATLSELLYGGRSRTYTRAERESFIREMINLSPDENVLSRYVSFLADRFEPRDRGDTVTDEI